LSLDDKNELSVIEARNNMLTELMLSFIDPSEDKLIKERILIFFRNARDDNKRFIGVPPIPEEGENMYVTDVVQWSSIFDVETRLRFYEALANYKNINYNLSSPETIEQELCHAVRKEALSYASALIDIGKDIVNIGKIRCTPGPYPKVFRGSTVGIKDDYEAKQVLGTCPMSLRRLSGVNAGAAIRARINAWQRNINIDRDAGYDQVKKDIVRSFSNVPKLNPVPGSMNKLLDPYDNYWFTGGDCTLESNERFHK
jgi:hypothetical protein